jgi:hypothetical protein
VQHRHGPTGVPADHFPSSRGGPFDPKIGKMIEAARATGATMVVPTSTGIGAPGTAPAPASLARSPMAASPSGAATAIPFTRGSTLATMRDALVTAPANSTNQVQLQTNAFLENIILDVALVTAGNAATVVFAADAPFNGLAQVKLDDPAGQSIIAPISGYQLYLLNKYLSDTDCGYDPQLDPNYAATAGSGATGGSFSFRLCVPIEHRRRDALGALNNSAANQRYLLTIITTSSYGGVANIYTTAPTTPATNITIQCYQQYWTSPPSVITTAQGQSAVQGTPSGLGTVGFVRYERHNEVSGGGTPQIQLNNVGDYITQIIWILRASAGVNARDVADWPSEFDFWINDFQIHALSLNDYQRWMHRWSRFTAATGTANGLDTGVFHMGPWMAGLFDRIENFAPANQYLPTDATTKLQIRGSTWGAGAGYLEVITRMVRPVSGAALFA